MIENATFEVGEGGIRLDAALLMRFPSVPRAFAREACETGMVKVNGRLAPKGMKLRGGERIDILRLDEAQDNHPSPDKAVRVRCIFEDGDLLAFDKPAGMSVQPLTRHETGTLMNGVVHRWPECIGVGDTPLMAGALHRIDSGTSGLVLVAKNAAAFDDLRSQFAELLHNLRRISIRPRDPKALLQEYLCKTAHADAADAHKVDGNRMLKIKFIHNSMGGGIKYKS